MDVTQEEERSVGKCVGRHSPRSCHLQRSRRFASPVFAALHQSATSAVPGTTIVHRLYDFLPRTTDSLPTRGKAKILSMGRSCRPTIPGKGGHVEMDRLTKRDCFGKFFFLKGFNMDRWRTDFCGYFVI